MARGLDKQQKAELADYLDSLYRLGGYTSQAQWAREAGYHQVNLSNAMSRKTDDGLDGYSLLKLTRAVAERAEISAESAAVRLAQETEPDVGDLHRRLAKLESTVEDQGESQTKALKALTAGIRRLERQLAAGAPPATGAGAR